LTALADLGETLYCGPYVIYHNIFHKTYEPHNATDPHMETAQITNEYVKLGRQWVEEAVLDRARTEDWDIAEVPFNLREERGWVDPGYIYLYPSAGWVRGPLTHPMLR
jgi:hypothetical protein